MIQETSGIHVYSDMNPWIDFVITIDAYEDFQKAEEIIRKAYDDWWELEEAESEAIGDWIGGRLTENDIVFEIYFKNEEDDY